MFIKGLTLFMLLLLIELPSSSHSQTPQGTILPYMTSNVEEVSGKSFDYIIVGGGACGCPLAATLSSKFSVLLIERGGSPYQNPIILEKNNYGLTLVQTDEFSSVAQSFTSTDGVSNKRARVLGGGTAIGDGFYSRAGDDYVKTNGWDKKLVKRAYEWVESKLITRPNLTLYQSVAYNSLLEAGILPDNGFSLENIEGTKISGTMFDKYGRRHFASDLLMAGNSKNITVLLNATVKNVIFRDYGNERPRAYGIKFIKSDENSNQEYEAYLNQRSDSSSWGDVILSAGALGSPQILLLSGLGPKEHLEKFNISNLVDLKGVGQEMKDNPGFIIQVNSKLPSLKADSPQVIGIANDFKFIVESIIAPISFNTTVVLVASKLAFISSKGKLELNNTDPRQNPLVTFNYLSEKNDLLECEKMSQLLHKVANTKSINMFLGNQYNTTLSTNEDEMRNFCLKNVGTFYHYHGGCVIGSVVDKRYKVYGVDGLRVVDGSTFLEAPGTNPMATLLMLGRYQGIKILRERNV